jgi:hypothetical protein
MCVILPFGACSLLDRSADSDSLNEKGTYWMTYDATRRAGFYIQREGHPMVLSEPAPDAAYSKLIGLAAEAKGDGGGASMKLDYSQNVVELTQRHVTVMMLREALFRLSELYVNGAFSGTGAKAMSARFDKSMDAVVELAQALRIQSEANQHRARAAFIEQVNSSTLSDQRKAQMIEGIK